MGRTCQDVLPRTVKNKRADKTEKPEPEVGGGGGGGGRGDGRVLNLTQTRQKVSGVYLLPDRK